MAYEVFEKRSRCPATVGRLNDKVMVVDDDEHFRALVRAILEPAGFQVIQTENIEKCLVELRRQAFDVVILDMVIPGRDGIEALQEIKTSFPEIRIVAVSGASLSELFLSVSAHLGADASLEKARISMLGPLLQVVLDR